MLSFKLLNRTHYLNVYKDMELSFVKRLLGEEALDVFNTFQLSDADQQDVDKVLDKFESYCIPKRNVTYKRKTLEG